jgi:hypothetical protein
MSNKLPKTSLHVDGHPEPSTEHICPTGRAEDVIARMQRRLEHLEVIFNELLKQPHTNQQINDVCLVKMELDQARIELSEFEAKQERKT